jgi:cyanate permease
MALSGFAQIVAYLSAAMAPPLMGLLYGTTSSWTVVLTTLLIVSVAANIPAAVILRRNLMVDTELKLAA